MNYTKRTKADAGDREMSSRRALQVTPETVTEAVTATATATATATMDVLARAGGGKRNRWIDTCKHGRFSFLFSRFSLICAAAFFFYLSPSCLVPYSLPFTLGCAM